ncbi:PucR family transcriptional regulator [Alteribacillus sp. HJP-4]|uniref:PucR family transcriptional regulator n=1 Tax=Alteribacillus sp. HJP-4 TaxID=2775394 RepID=UPI0035CCF6F7
MTITLKEAMKIGGLRECRIIAGYQGIENKLNYVTIMEVPDIVKWLKGNELLLTSLYPIKDDKEAQRNLIRELHERGTSALAIKPNRFTEYIPYTILEAAEKYCFPVIEIPERISYLDILSPVMNSIFDRKVVLQEDIEEAYRLLNEVSLNESSINHLIHILTHLTKHNIAIESLVSFVNVAAFSSSFQPLHTQQVEELELVQRPIRLQRKHTDGKSTSCITSPIIVDGKVYGVISSWDEENEHIEADLAILERASSVLALEFMRKKVRYEIEIKYKSDFFRSLLKEDILSANEMKENAKIYNIHPDHRYICCAVYVERELFLTDQLTKIELIIKQIETDAVVGVMNQMLYILFPSIDKEESDVLLQIRRLIRELQASLKIIPAAGIGRIAEADVTGIQESFRQAELAISISRSLPLKENAVVHYDELGVYRLFVHMDKKEEMVRFHQETVGNLIEYDKNHNLELMRTVEAYFLHNESLAATSESLYIHVNTLKYRLQKVKTLTGLSFQHSEEKMMIQLGMKIHYFLTNSYLTP